MSYGLACNRRIEFTCGRFEGERAWRLKQAVVPHQPPFPQMLKIGRKCRMEVVTKGKHFAKNLYFPPPVNGNFSISSLFFGEKKRSNVEVCSKFVLFILKMG